MVRSIIAAPAVVALDYTTEIAAVLTGASILRLMASPALPVATGIVVALIAVLGAVAVEILCTAPLLPTLTGGRRAVEDAAREVADGVADWAGWDWTDASDPDSPR